MRQKKLGQRIATSLRRSRQLTQEQLAEAVDCSVDFISLVKRGVNPPSVAGLAKFARVLKVEVRDEDEAFYWASGEIHRFAACLSTQDWFSLPL